MQQILDDIAAQMAIETDRGKVADYIPQLAHVDPNQFGIAVATPDGKMYTAGNASTLFSIQSISKIFTLTIALGKLGDGLWTHVGREPSGDPFNSIVMLEHETGRPRNPFINAGAIAVVDAIMMGTNLEKYWLRFYSLCTLLRTMSPSVLTTKWQRLRWRTKTATPRLRTL